MSIVSAFGASALFMKEDDSSALAALHGRLAIGISILSVEGKDPATRGSPATSLGFCIDPRMSLRASPGRSSEDLSELNVAAHALSESPGAA